MAPSLKTCPGQLRRRLPGRCGLSATGLFLLLGASLLPAPSQAGPIARRYQERKACETFAGKLKEASANPAMAQQVYQQGVLALVAKFGENPCGDIPAPVAAPAAGAAVAAPVVAPAGPATAAPAVVPTAAPAVRPVVPAAAAAAVPSAEQQQACTTFASKLSAAAASGGAAQARQVYAMGSQKLTGMFGPNPCPAVKAPL
ncbi:MAG: hypothetical protein WAM11_02010 [Cyanobium sp.]